MSGNNWVDTFNAKCDKFPMLQRITASISLCKQIIWMQKYNIIENCWVMNTNFIFSVGFWKMRKFDLIGVVNFWKTKILCCTFLYNCNNERFWKLLYNINSKCGLKDRSFHSAKRYCSFYSWLEIKQNKTKKIVCFLDCRHSINITNFVFANSTNELTGFVV